MPKKAPASKSRAKVIRKKANAMKCTLVIGHARFTKISAVEGLVFSKAMRTRKEEFDRTGMSAAKRREAIIKAYKR